jgi:hypothetical protein
MCPSLVVTLWALLGFFSRVLRVPLWRQVLSLALLAAAAFLALEEEDLPFVQARLPLTLLPMMF